MDRAAFIHAVQSELIAQHAGLGTLDVRKPSSDRAAEELACDLPQIDQADVAALRSELEDSIRPSLTAVQISNVSEYCEWASRAAESLRAAASAPPALVSSLSHTGDSLSGRIFGQLGTDAGIQLGLLGAHVLLHEPSDGEASSADSLLLESKSMAIDTVRCARALSLLVPVQHWDEELPSKLVELETAWRQAYQRAAEHAGEAQPDADATDSDAVELEAADALLLCLGDAASGIMSVSPSDDDGKLLITSEVREDSTGHIIEDRLLMRQQCVSALVEFDMDSSGSAAHLSTDVRMGHLLQRIGALHLALNSTSVSDSLPVTDSHYSQLCNILDYAAAHKHQLLGSITAKCICLVLKASVLPIDSHGLGRCATGAANMLDSLRTRAVETTTPNAIEIHAAASTGADAAASTGADAAALTGADAAALTGADAAASTGADAAASTGADAAASTRADTCTAGIADVDAATALPMVELIAACSTTWTRRLLSQPADDSDVTALKAAAQAALLALGHRSDGMLLQSVGVGELLSLTALMAAHTLSHATGHIGGASVDDPSSPEDGVISAAIAMVVERIRRIIGGWTSDVDGLVFFDDTSIETQGKAAGITESMHGMDHSGWEGEWEQEAQTTTASAASAASAAAAATSASVDDPASKARRQQRRMGVGSALPVGEAGEKAKQASGLILKALERASESVVAGVVDGSDESVEWVKSLGLDAQLRRVLEAAYDSKLAADEDVSGKGDGDDEDDDHGVVDGDRDSTLAAEAMKLRAARVRRATLATDLAVVAARLTKASRIAKRILDSRIGISRTKGD